MALCGGIREGGEPAIGRISAPAKSFVAVSQLRAVGNRKINAQVALFLGNGRCDLT